jgi:hypothetical protein
MKTLLLAASLAVAAPASAEDHAVNFDEWSYVCAALVGLGYSRVDCQKIQPPTVVVSKIVRDATRRGILFGVTYDGEPYVFVNPSLSRENQRLIVIHETVHYVLWQAYGAYGVPVDRCKSEEVARIVERARAGSPSDESWRVWYGC